MKRRNKQALLGLYSIALGLMALCVGIAFAGTVAYAGDLGGKASKIAAPAAKPTDLEPGRPSFLPNAADAPLAQWTGAYVSAGGGYGFTGLETTVFDCLKYSKCVNGTEDARLAQGWRGDGRLGFDWQTGSLVFGVFGGHEFGESKFTDTTSYGPIDVRLTPTWYVGGRVGVPQGRTLWYAGGAYQNAEIEAKGPGPFSRDIDGWKALGGVETAITPQFSLALEVGHTWYEDVTNQVERSPGVRYEPRDTEVMLRAIYRPFAK